MKKYCFGLIILLLIVPIVPILIGIGITGCSEDNVLSPEKQLEKDAAKIDKYLTDNGITAVIDPSGLRYVMKTIGTGPRPGLSSLITVKYTGKFLSTGALFDQSKTPPEQFTTPVSDLIVGWQVGIPLLAKGGTATFYVPSGLAYGRAGKGSVPSNANLIFDVELLDFRN